MGNNKVLIITGNSSFETMLKYIESENITVEYAFRGYRNNVLSVIRILSFKLKVPFRAFWYRRINTDRFSKIIVLDSFMNEEYLSFLVNTLNDKQKKIFYYWNKYDGKRLQISKVKEQGFEPWSFDEQDCVRYGMKYNPQFYARSWYQNINQETLFDVSFVGRDKGNRTTEIDDWIQKMRKEGLTVQTYITAGKWYKRFKSRRYQKYLDYKQVIKTECAGKAILDYSASEQSGFTMRMFDGLVNRRKVITNNKKVLSADFYSPSMIFVLGYDNIKNIKEFLKRPVDEITMKYIENYELEKWAERF